MGVTVKTNFAVIALMRCRYCGANDHLDGELNMGIEIVLADDHELVRQGLCSLIEGEKDLEIVAQADNGRDAVKLVDEHTPDVVVLDVHMPDLNGVEATRQICDQHPGIKVIALSVYSTKQFVDGMLKAGASGYLIKSCAFEELANAIRIVVNNQSYLSPEIQKMLVTDYVANNSDPQKNKLTMLTAREREILQLVAEGLSSEAIAERLFLSVKTISSHRRQILKKLNLKSVADLTRFAIKEGVISID